MGDGTQSDGATENRSTVGSGRVDELFDDIEETIERLDGFSDELTSLHKRIAANEGETSGHVRDRVNEDADQLADEAADAADRLREHLQTLKRDV
ncbi:hypothetical protein [Haloarchaeobius sp. HRN-SO-5]|uniref:hypothetical protein n=1 Tax=Haloarchaeobius sp. HRN-SO-5 TaxID=3446118 RepID=UPI003EBD9CE1